MKNETLSRRNFFKGAALASAAIALPTLAGCSGSPSEDSATTNPSWMPETWDREVDIVIVGTGGGGLMAGITATANGDEVLVVEKAPEERAGGNSRVCGQLVFCPNDVNGAIEYQRNLNGLNDVSEEALEGWAKALVGLPALLDDLGATLTEYKGSLSPEFPGFGGEGVAKVYYYEKPNYSTLWTFLKETFDDEGVEVLYETPGNRLIQNPETKEIVGILAGREGSEISIKARKGVLLACGGFANNQKMAQTYLSEMPIVSPMGTPYNTGDGIKMAINVGADLSHMASVAGPYFSFRHPDLEVSIGPVMATKRHILVNNAGKRFINENGTSKHGKIEIDGSWQSTPTPLPVFQIFDDVNMNATSLFQSVDYTTWAGVIEKYKGSDDNQEELAKGWIIHGSSIEDLAEKIGLDPIALRETIETYNGYAAQNHDPEFGRGMPTEEILTEGGVRFDLEPITGPNYYAVSCAVGLVNTQGGPRRSGKAEIVGRDGSPIPRLYSAGELGAMYPNLYNGGGNFADTIAFGNLAAMQINALTPWE